jgi:DNA helicase-2/ATP-dependent DNA helicase PcrA
VLASKPDRTLGDIAILYRAATPSGDEAADAATAAGLNYIRVDTSAPYKKVGLTSWIEDCASWCSGGWRVGSPKIAGLATRWIGFHSGNLSLQKAHAEKARLVQFLMNNRSDDRLASAFVQSIKTQLVDPLATLEPSLADQYEQVRKMATAFAAGGKLEGLEMASLGGRDGSPDHLNLLTLHSAKGCEYDVVIMIGMDNGMMPWRNETATELRESRRLFYVGLTRARDAVYMLYSGWYSRNGYVNRYGRSVFVEELEERLNQT